MNPNFASLVDPIFLKVLALVESVRKNKGTTYRVERQLLERAFRESEAKSSDEQAWSLAKYALACWIDDLLIATEWSGQEWWEGNSLEFAFFNTKERATNFFIKAKESSQLPRRDALEVYYLCVVLGFRGLYSLEEATVIADHLSLPITLSEWVKETAGSLQLRQGRPSFQETPQPPRGAPALENRYRMVGALLAAIVLVVLLLTMRHINGILDDKQSTASPESATSDALVNTNFAVRFYQLSDLTESYPTKQARALPMVGLQNT
jgi:type VI secretion system protein ImpK